MKIPKYFCSTCGKPSSRKSNLYRHIGNCHDRKLCFKLGWTVDTYRPHWNRWERKAMKQKENSHYIRPDLMKQFFSSNESNDRKPFDFQLMLTEAFLKELAEKMAASIIQPSISFPFFPMSSPMQSPVGN